MLVGLCYRKKAAVTSSELHVHQCISDDGEESVGERMSTQLPMKNLNKAERCEQVKCNVVFIYYLFLLISVLCSVTQDKYHEMINQLLQFTMRLLPFSKSDCVGYMVSRTIFGSILDAHDV